MSIRKCVINDVYEIHNLLNMLEETEFELRQFTTIFQDIIASVNNHCFVYCIEEKVVGFINLNIEYKLHHHNKVCEIEELIIDPDYRGRKIGSKLLEYGMKIAEEIGCELIELTSNVKRTRAHQFYVSHAFVNNGYRFIRKL